MIPMLLKIKIPRTGKQPLSIYLPLFVAWLILLPINLIRAGLKWASFIPNHSQKKVGDALKEKGLDVDLSTLTPEDLDELIINLNDLQVEVDGDEVVRVFCE